MKSEWEAPGEGCGESGEREGEERKIGPPAMEPCLSWSPTSMVLIHLSHPEPWTSSLKLWVRLRRGIVGVEASHV